MPGYYAKLTYASAPGERATFMKMFIGKSSPGWVFQMRAYPHLGINTMGDWVRYIYLDRFTGLAAGVMLDPASEAYGEALVLKDDMRTEQTVTDDRRLIFPGRDLTYEASWVIEDEYESEVSIEEVLQEIRPRGGAGMSADAADRRKQHRSGIVSETTIRERKQLIEHYCYTRGCSDPDSLPEKADKEELARQLDAFRCSIYVCPVSGLLRTRVGYADCIAAGPLYDVFARDFT